jgi:hypothetical protein
VLNVQRNTPELIPKVASGELKLVDAVKKEPADRRADHAVRKVSPTGESPYQ